MRVFKVSIVAHQLHHPDDIMPVESFIKLKDGAGGYFYL